MASPKIFKKVTRSFVAGEIIFLKGAVCDGIYSIQSGEVSVYQTKATPEGPKDVELVKLGPGSIFGEMGMLDNGRRDASVRAIIFTEVILITRQMFNAQLAELPPWTVNFIKILNNRLRSTNEKLTNALQVLDANGLRLEGQIRDPAIGVPAPTEIPPEQNSASPSADNPSGPVV